VHDEPEPQVCNLARVRRRCLHRVRHAGLFPLRSVNQSLLPSSTTVRAIIYGYRGLPAARVSFRSRWNGPTRLQPQMGGPHAVRRLVSQRQTGEHACSVNRQGEWNGPPPASEEDSFLRAVAEATNRPPRTVRPADIPNARSLPKPGDRLAGKYHVERILGAGGMGVVVAARHVQLDVPVALKFMIETALADQGLVMRFQREARATARLRSEHVVRVSDVGTLDSGAPYMVMEYLEGEDLAALLGRLGRPPIANAVEYLQQACEALDEAHRAGLVHRDVKPANLFLTRRPNGTPCIKVLDFGISKGVQMASEAGSLHATDTQAVFGSPLYMAPEQMRSARDVDARADIWSLGATLYELLTGRAPFVAESLINLMFSVANDSPPPLRAMRPEIPSELEKVVLRCLEKDREKRYPDVRAVASAMAPFAPGPSRMNTPLERGPQSSGESDTIITDYSEPAANEKTVAQAPRAPVPALAVEKTRKSEEIRAMSGPTGDADGPGINKALPLEPAVGGASPASPLRAVAAQGWRTGNVSWGSSQRFKGARSRAIGYVLAFSLAGAAVAVALFSMRTRLSRGPVEPSVDAHAAAAPPNATNLMTLIPSAPPSAAATSQTRPAPSHDVPTLSVTDLPVASQPPAQTAAAPRWTPPPRPPTPAVHAPDAAAGSLRTPPIVSANRPLDPLANPN
jgi:serine/threonine protein kinase